MPLLFASALTRKTDPAEASNDLAQQLRRQLLGQQPDLALVFVSGHWRQAAAMCASAVEGVQARAAIGCTAESVIGRDEEVENADAVSAVAAVLPGAEIAGFSISADDWPEVLSDPAHLSAQLPPNFVPKLFILLADPFSSPMDDVLDLFNQAFPGVPVAGGMASAANAAQLRDGDEAFNDVLICSTVPGPRAPGGAVGLAIAGEVDVDVVVSQGCRPIGRPLTVSGAERNMLTSLDDRPPMLQLQQIFDDLSVEDRQLLRNGIYLGRAIDSSQAELGRGDFLIRGIMGADPEHGYLAVGDYLQPGERVQFHLHDGYTATEDLELLLLPQTLQDPPAGAFLFSCNGRGSRLYGRPNGDIETVQQFLSDAPLAGFFCAGEIGPVGGRNFLHGHTASLVIFRPAGGTRND